MAQQPRRRRHLLDPDNPVPPPTRGGMSLTTVQRWVLSVLAVTTIGHLAVGLVFGAAYADGSRAGAELGLLVIAGVVGVLGVAVGFLIHERSPVTPWLVTGLVPGLVGALVLL